MRVFGISVRTLLLSAVVVGIIAFFVNASVQGFTNADPCAGLKTCVTCADTGGCGWCPDTNKCVRTDRNGFPAGKACNSNTFVTFANKCTASKTPGLSSISGRSGPPLKLPDYSRAGGASCNTTDLVDKAQKDLEPKIKGAVEKILTKYGIPLKEGFQVDPKLSMLMSQIQDQVTRIAEASVKASKK